MSTLFIHGENQPLDAISSWKKATNSSFFTWHLHAFVQMRISNYAYNSFVCPAAKKKSTSDG